MIKMIISTTYSLCKKTATCSIMLIKNKYINLLSYVIYLHINTFIKDYKTKKCVEK